MSNLRSAEAWVTIGGFLLLLIGSVIGLSKRNQARRDAKVLNYMEEHARKSVGGARSRTVANISLATGMSESQVTKSLTRLQKARKLWEHGENWMLIQSVHADLILFY